MLAVFKREFKAYFTTPIGYIVLAAFYFFLGFFFTTFYVEGSPEIGTLVMQMQPIIIFLIPVLTMRLMSEDRRQKVDQALLTSPAKLSGIVVGKFLAAFSVYAICFAPSLIFELITADHLPTLNFFPYFYALLGMLLLGAALIALGMFISSLTESQVVAAISGIIANVLISVIGAFATSVANNAKIPEFVIGIAQKVGFINNITSFSLQVISFSDIIYFLSITVIFLFLSVRSLEKRRWS